MGLKERAKDLRTYVPALFLAMKRRDTPIVAKVLACITVGYALSPIDIVPDFIPILGYLDDIVILPLLAALSIKLIPRSILDECLVRAQNMWEDGKPKKWYYALPILFFWTVVAAIAVSRAVK